MALTSELDKGGGGKVTWPQSEGHWVLTPMVWTWCFKKKMSMVAVVERCI